MVSDIKGMFGENDDKLKRKIPNVHIYRIEGQDENYRPTIQVICGWLYDEECGLPVYFYYDFETS